MNAKEALEYMKWEKEEYGDPQILAILGSYHFWYNHATNFVHMGCIDDCCDGEYEEEEWLEHYKDETFQRNGI